MAVTLDLPTTQEEIPGAIRKLREELAAAQARVKAIQGGIAAVQAMCAHPHKTSGKLQGVDHIPDPEARRCILRQAASAIVGALAHEAVVATQDASKMTPALEVA